MDDFQLAEFTEGALNSCIATLINGSPTCSLHVNPIRTPDQPPYVNRVLLAVALDNAPIRVLQAYEALIIALAESEIIQGDKKQPR